jgi:hypothetical protein
VSLDAQRAKVKAYAELYDLELAEVIVDAGESAKSLDRPGLKRALGMLKAGEAEALLVVKLDRLTRSVVDLGTLVERYFAPGKAALLSVGEQIDTRSAAGRLVLNVLASVSQWEREAIGERTCASPIRDLARRRRTGWGCATRTRQIDCRGAPITTSGSGSRDRHSRLAYLNHRIANRGDRGWWARSAPALDLSAQGGAGRYAAARHSYRWCRPPMRGRPTNWACAGGRGCAGRAAGVAFPRPRWVRSSW